MAYGEKLKLRTTRGLEGTRQKVIVTHNRSEIDQNQLQLYRFSNLDSDDVSIPGKENLSFNIEFSWRADPQRA